MAKRARMTTEDVLDELELVDNQDDFDEPMMPGSDDEFSDCEFDENLEDGNDSGDEQNTPPSPTQQNMPTPTLPADWSTNLTSLTMSDFNSSVGPTVPVPENVSEVFDLMHVHSILHGHDCGAEQTGDGREVCLLGKYYQGGAQGILGRVLSRK